MGAFEFGILGPLEIRHQDVPVPVRGTREQAVLGVLLLEAGHIVPLAKLVAAVWDGDPPQAAEKAVRNTISALRGRFARADGAARVIETCPAGYRLRLEGHRLDAAEFREHADAARELASAGRAGEAVAHYRAALGVWRGPALAGLDSRVIHRGAARLEEQRLIVWEDCLEAELRLGRHRRITDELRGLADEWPLRERLAGLLMLALYRSGRQAEALQAYHRLAGRLADELGIDPSGEITRLHEAILRQDLSLAPDLSLGSSGPDNMPGTGGDSAELTRPRALPPAAGKARDAARGPGAALTWLSGSHPAATAGYVGRERELNRLGQALGRGMTVLVVGDAGVGKTRFCAEGMARAAAAGMLLVRGECLPVAGTLPLLPVADALRELGRVDDGALLTAVLDSAPGFVREELGRLLPQFSPAAGQSADGWDGGWRRERLFSAVAELLTTAAGRARSGAGLVIEDIHWADSATLDFLTFLTRAGHRSAVTVVVTFRGDEAPLASHVAGWLADARARADVEEILLGPLSRAEVAEQVAELTAGTERHLPPRVVDELYRRAEGNPFFTEQLVAAALADPADGTLEIPEGLPPRLAELLAARAGRCAGDARAVLAALAVAGRPLSEDQIAVITGLSGQTVRSALRELAETRLLAESTADTGNRPRHALLCEAVAAELLPGERAALHERTARALAAAGGRPLAAEVAGHWRAAGHPSEELPARVAAAEAAEQVFGYAEAAAHWQRAIELCRRRPDDAAAAGISTPWLYVRAIDALFLSGDSLRAGAVATEAYRSFSGHPDPATAAAICHRAAVYRTDEPPAARLLVMEEALRLFDRVPPSADHAEALLDYAVIFLLMSQRQLQATGPALNRARSVAEAAGAMTKIPRIVAVIAYGLFLRGQVEEGFETIERGRALAEAYRDGSSMVWLAINHSDALLKLARFRDAAEVALDGLDAARKAGLEAWDSTSALAANAAEALLALGHTAEAAAVIDPLTTMPPGQDHCHAQVARAEIDLLRGDTEAAVSRWRLIHAYPAVISRVDIAYEAARRAVEAELWCGRPGDALREAQRALALFTVPDLTVLCGRLLTAGMRACADLAERARAHHDAQGAAAAVAAAEEMASWVERMAGAPFTDHRLVATIPAERATWNAERARLAGRADPDAWAAAAQAWQDLGCPHRAAYAWWRRSEALLDTGQSSAASAAAAGALRAAALAADGHAPLLAKIRTLARRAGVPLEQPPPRPASGLITALTRQEPGRRPGATVP